MPAPDVRDAPVAVAIGGAEVFAGFTLPVVLTVYLVLGLPTLALLIGMGRETVRVDGEGLHAGGRTLPLTDVASARALGARETRHRLGPGADPRAHVVNKGYIHESVLVRPAGDDATPYWLVSTRHPEQLLAVLSRSGAVTP
jgi:hypothetical protein